MKESILFDFATVQDLESCKQIVARKLQANQADCDDLEDLTKDIMKLSYSIGGSLSLIHISEPTRQAEISYAVFCLKKKKKTQLKKNYKYPHLN